jgi:anaerobic selenocysteine-containing dehydrogenase/Fe-S-cluster-containing dehydrogenase component
VSATVEPDAAAAAGGVKRRDFLKILGAGTAVTASVGCSTKGVGHLIPYLVSPDETVPGVSTYYASTCRECAASCGILVETRDGRITKLEGNPAHPLNRGALCARGQAAPQGLYNPDRYREPMVRKDGKLVPTTWDDALHLLAQKLGEVRSRNQAAGAAFVNLHESGAFPGFLDDWLAAFGMPPHISFDPDLPSATLAANRESYGVSWPGLDFSAAHVVVSFGADFLDGWGANVPQQLDWADARGKLADAPRLIYVGARRSLTGLNADEWIPAKPGSQVAIANAVLGSLGKSTGVTIAQAATESGVDAAVLERLASMLAQAKPSLVLAGGSGVHTLDLARAVNAINQAAGNVGQTVKPAEAITAFEHAATYADIRDLADRMKKGAVPILMVRGANPAFSTPPALGFAAAMEKVPFKVSFSSYPDETAELCDLVLPDHHALESWGEASPVVGTMSLQQPGMDPVFASRQTADVLVSVAKGDPALAAKYPWPDYRTWLISRFPGAATGFTNALTTGVVTSVVTSGATAEAAPKAEGRSANAKAQAAKPGAFKSAAPVPGATIEQSKGDFYLVIYPSPALGDGRGANKPWLQELPDPVTKIVWQTVIEIHPETARKLGVEAGDHLRVETDTGSLEAPAFVYLGIRPDTVAVSLGRGHTAYGRYARNQGLSPLGLIPTSEDQAGALALTCTKARVSKGADHTLLVSTEGSARQHGRGIARALTVSELAAAPSPETQAGAGGAAAGATAGGAAAEGAGTAGPAGEAEEMPGDASHAFLPGLRSPVANDAQGDYGDTASKSLGMYAADHWSGMAKRRWAMTVDLARCTGCSACVTACYAENNIPTVGAPWQGAQVMPDHTGFGANILRGREMAWIRLERYFEGANHDDGRFDPDFETRFIPMLCQQCGNAPCEPVCPVYATYHSPDGLNVQVYNRCVGTRYCSNNCPYKVRYFNWFGYGESDRIQYAFPEPLNWQLNPDVTVRGKGVMEKCTFCLQRIREAEHRARLEHRELEPDEFTVACAQACPSRAITFGDAADPRWSMTKMIEDRRAYHVFEELNTFTAVVYLKRVTHPAPSAPATT